MQREREIRVREERERDRGRETVDLDTVSCTSCNCEVKNYCDDNLAGKTCAAIVRSDTRAYGEWFVRRPAN